MATDLQTIDPNQPTPWSPPVLGSRLASLIGNALPEKLPVITDGEADEARRALAVYRDHPKGTPVRLISRMVTWLANGYPNSKVSDAEAEARLELYCEMLADIDSDLLGQAFREAVKTSKFFPSISEIRDIAAKLPATERMVHAHRLRVLLDRHAQGEEPAVVPVTPEEQAAIKAEVGLEAAQLLDRIVGSEAA